MTAARGHTEELPDGDSGVAEVKLGVWTSTTKSRRAKLIGARLDQLADLGLHWR
ncbi:hypothetical protein KNE206_54180 [Kitasatospora sp. NE20-6]|uniref:hypothetical protein n=1 Tax=Kitasatospora sp. NE20-6 TaxID=2859066 RepID=UPI0034DC0ADA